MARVRTRSGARSALTIPPLADRLAAGRPVLSQDQMQTVAHRILALTTAPDAQVRLTNTVRTVTRMARGQVVSGDDGDSVTIHVRVSFDGLEGQRGSHFTRIQTNQLDDRVLRAIVAQCERINRDRVRRAENPYPNQLQVQDPYVPVQLWHEETVDAMRHARETALPALLQPVTNAGLTAAGFVGLVAQSQAYYSKAGITAYAEETDSEVTLTVRGAAGRSGWSGQTARSWTAIDPARVAVEAIEMAERSAHPVAVEPGRRTAILSSFAVGQIARAFATQFIEDSGSGFERGNRRVNWGGRYFDPRITIRTDPADPEGGYCPYFGSGYGTPAMTFIDQGRLRNLATSLAGAMWKGKPYVETPYSMRIEGGTTTLPEMIANCEEGIYVNHLYGIRTIDHRTGTMTGVTRDGCFLVKHSKIERPVKNFRIEDSPFFFLNNLVAIGVPRRVSLGYVPPPASGWWGSDEEFGWPLPPIIVPPLMVRDFNFSSLSDAV